MKTILIVALVSFAAVLSLPALEPVDLTPTQKQAAVLAVEEAEKAHTSVDAALQAWVLTLNSTQQAAIAADKTILQQFYGSQSTLAPVDLTPTQKLAAVKAVVEAIKEHTSVEAALQGWVLTLNSTQQAAIAADKTILQQFGNGSG